MLAGLPQRPGYEATHFVVRCARGIVASVVEAALTRLGGRAVDAGKRETT